MKKGLILIASTLIASAAFAADNHADMGQYGNHCAYGLTMGKQVPTDCHVNWVDPASHKKYCFLNEENKANWAKDTATNIKKANEEYTKLAGHTTEHHS